MAAAEVGDDVFDEDPTVHRLQDRVAELLGTEAALFVPTGTMANQICLRVHTPPGRRIDLRDDFPRLCVGSRSAGRLERGDHTDCRR